MMDRIYYYFIRIVAVVLAIFFLIPVVWMLALSFTPEGENVFANER